MILSPLFRSLSVLALGTVLLAGASAQENPVGTLKPLGKVQQVAPPTFAYRVAVYQKASRSMTPVQAAAGWLALLDRAEAPLQSQGDMASLNERGFSKLAEAIPAPEAWPAIAAGIHDRTAKKKTSIHTASLDLFAEMLAGTPDSQWKAMDEILSRSHGQGYEYGVLDLYQELALRTGDKDRLADAITRQYQKKERAGFSNMPDLVSAMGPEKAEPLLLLILKSSSETISYIEGERTTAALRRIALAHLKEVKRAQWHLVGGPQTIDLYEGFLKRFGPAKPPKGENYSEDYNAFQQAKLQYVFALLSQSREADAIRVGRTLGDSFYPNFYENSERVEALIGTPIFTRFLGALVDNNPKSPLWQAYTVSAVGARKSGPVEASIKAILARPKLPGDTRLALRSQLATIYLSTDRVEEGITMLEKAAQEPGADQERQQTVAVRYARIGSLLNRPKMLAKGLAWARTLDGVPESQLSPTNAFDQEFLDLLADLGRYDEGFQVASKNRDRVIARFKRGETSYSDQPNAWLKQMARFDYLRNQPKAVRKRLDVASDWGVTDVSALVDGWTEYGVIDPPSFVAAWGLAKSGAPNPAEKTLMRVLTKYPGYDPAYRLLVDLKGAEAIPVLDRLYATDQFEERPLIWKAVVLKNLGRLDEAETTLRKAISIDPSDGETHGGHRLYAYTVLGQIRKAKGDAAGAAEAGEVIKAIRTAERADEFGEVGLIPQGIALYKQSLRHFDDAYCIQSRLAVQLMDEGRPQEAAEHYRKAYELMPFSFGRVETHCMGCEGVFRGKLAQNIAEETFTALAQKTPDKPQVHYLLGYLRQEQDRFAEAATSYRRAVQLDPDYLNAWKQLASISDDIAMPPDERQEIAGQILRLDPLQKHGYRSGLEESLDLAEIWRRTEPVVRLQGASSGSLYPLAASAALARKNRDYGMSYSSSDKPISSPGEAVMKDATMSRLIDLMENSKWLDAAPAPTEGME